MVLKTRKHMGLRIVLKTFESLIVVSTASILLLATCIKPQNATIADDSVCLTEACTLRAADILGERTVAIFVIICCNGMIGNVHGTRSTSSKTEYEERK